MKRTLLRLLRFIGRYRFLLFLSSLCALASVACNLTAPLIVGKAVDFMAGAGRVNFPAVGRMLALLALVFLVGNAFLWFLGYLTSSISYRAVNRLRLAMFRKLTLLPVGFFDRTPHGDTVSRFVNDADTVADGLLQSLTALLQGIVTIVGAVAFMLSLNARMTLVVILSAPLSYLTARWITTRSQKLFREQASTLGKLNGYAEEIIAGQKTVEAFRQEPKALRKFKALNSELYRTGVRSQFISSLSNPSTRIVNNLSYAAVGIFGSLAAIRGTLTVGEISSFLIYTAVFAKPFNDITNILSQIQAAAASAQRLFQVLDLPPETPDLESAQVLHGCVGHVEFSDVSFSYTPGTHLIEHFSLDVAPGSRIAVVGKTGAGKTTLINLLMRFYEIDGGSIRVDGRDIRTLTRESLRAQFGMVSQETWLFDGTIRENIAYARPAASDREIAEAARDAGADGFIRRLEKGYETRISSDGSGLSEGQKQLLAIARVMLANPPMLILDEATSSIDTSTEMRIQRAFDRLTSGRTSFVIAHRLSTVRNADRILVLDRGRIVESGTHRELLKKGGYYKKLYDSQFAGEHPFS